MPLVGLVTPADTPSPTFYAFQDELCNRFGWPLNTLTLYAASDHGGIEGAADAAYKNLSKDGVLVAAGEMAAFFLQKKTGPANQVPIILAYGGEPPSNAAANMSGFKGDCVAVALQHLTDLKSHGHQGQNVTVLYDPDDDNHVTKKVLAALIGADPDIKPLKKLPAEIHGLTAGDLTTSGLMLIPNAAYYRYADVISSAADNSPQVKIAHYPEVEFWRHHKNRKNIAHVYGHNVPLTYRLAASWVDNLLRGYWTVNSMPGFKKAFIENY